MALEWFACQQTGQSAHGAPDGRESLVAKAKDDDAGRVARRVASHIAEIEIHRDQCSTLGYGRGEQRIIDGASEAFIARQGDIVTGGTQHVARDIRQILVELQQRHGYVGTGTMRSRARSAA